MIGFSQEKFEMEATVSNSEISSVGIHGFHEVENASEIRAAIFSSKIPVCLVQPKLVWDKFQLEAAIGKTIQNQKDGTMKTRSFATEILYWLSPSTNISESLKTFGAGDDAREFLVISKESDFEQVRGLIRGTEISYEELAKKRDTQRIEDVYGLSQAGDMYKCSSDSMSSYIVSKTMTKELC